MSLRAVICLVRRRLLGAHVVRRARAQPGLRHPPARRRAHRQRDPEVHHHRPPVVQQDVLGLDVAVDHPVAVRVVQRVGHLGGDPHRLVDAELRLAVQLVADRLALDVGHDVVEEAVGLARVEQRQDVRVLQCGGGLDLLRRTARRRARRRARACRTLMATLRSCLRSSARYTVAMPPAPSSRSMR